MKNIKKYQYQCNNNLKNNFIKSSSILKNFKTLSYNDFLKQYKENLNTLKEKIKNKSSTCIEGGHIYTDEKITNNHLYQLNITAHMYKFLDTQGINNNSMLFIDDFHPEKNIFHLETYQDIAKSLGLEFSNIISETLMQPVCKKLFSNLEKQKLIIEKNNQYLLKHKKQPLIKKNNGDFSCAMLDSALTKIKLDHNEAAINILPQQYKKQQEYMKIISEKSLQKQLNLHTFLTK